MARRRAAYPATASSAAITLGQPMIKATVDWSANQFAIVCQPCCQVISAAPPPNARMPAMVSV